jgi:hypothetical protein
MTSCLLHDSRPEALRSSPSRRLRYDLFTHDILWCCASHGLAQYIRSLYPPNIPNYISSHLVYNCRLLCLLMKIEQGLYVAIVPFRLLECSHRAISLLRRKTIYNQENLNLAPGSRPPLYFYIPTMLLRSNVWRYSLDLVNISLRPILLSAAYSRLYVEKNTGACEPNPSEYLHAPSSLTPRNASIAHHIQRLTTFFLSQHTTPL